MKLENEDDRREQKPASGGQLSLETNSLPQVFEKPRRQSGCGLWTLVLLLVIAIGATVSWQFMDTQTKGNLTTRFSAMVDGTPLDFLRGLFEPVTTPPVPPINESGDHGVIPLPEESTAHAVLAPIEPEAAEEPAEAAGPETLAAEKEELPPPPPPEDERVRPAFIEDLAAWLVARYQPGSQGGYLAVSVQSLNQRYGIGLNGFKTGSGLEGRASLLRYVFTPSMVRGLYGIYADRFLRALATAAQNGKKPLGGAQLGHLYRALGSRCVLLAGGLESVCALPDLSGRLRALDQLVQNEIDSNRALLDARFDLERLRDNQGSDRELARAEQQVQQAEIALRAAMAAVTGERRRLCEDIRRNGSGALNDDTVLYLARWVNRRLAENPNALESAGAAARVLRDLSSRCAKAAREGAPAETTRSVAPVAAAPAAVPAAHAPAGQPAEVEEAETVATPSFPTSPLPPAPRPVRP